MRVSGTVMVMAENFCGFLLGGVYLPHLSIRVRTNFELDNEAENFLPLGCLQFLQLSRRSNDFIEVALQLPSYQ